MSEPEWLIRNRANWDERVPIHLASRAMYDQSRLRAGTARLRPIEMAVLGPVEGQKILHLQCHFGMDTLTLAQNGALATGVDFSAPAIAAAESLADELGLQNQTRFVVSDVYQAPSMTALTPASFDRVFVSWGALCWLPDMAGWAKVVAHFLKPGGWLALAEAHPAAYVFDSRTKTQDGMPGWFAPYLGREPMIEDREDDYADASARLKATRTHEWLHPLSDILMGLVNAGLRIDQFHEHDVIPWPMFDCLQPTGDALYRWPGKPWLPLAFSLRATKPA